MTIPVKNVTVNLSALNANETIALKKQHKLMTVIVNATTGLNRTYYTIYKTIKMSGETSYGSGANILGLVVFSIAVGLVAGRMGTKAKAFVDFINVLNDVVMVLVVVVMW